MSIEGKSLEEKKSFLERCAATTLSSKLIGGEKDLFVKTVDLITALDENNCLSIIGIKKVILATSSSMFAQNMFRSL
jgi:T-complex protein 1 subunit eta